ncbi:MAG: trigger factor [Alphaproteobacteria bacterium]|nr:trigger factor [Alphaproteobacteria bacterium]
MQLIETNNEGLKRAFKVIVPAGDLAEKVTAKLTEIGKTVRMQGFRPGKVPMPLLRQRYAKSVMGEVLEAAVQESVGQTIAERKLRPAMQPKIEITSFPDGGDLEFTVDMDLLPEFELQDFSALKLERPRAEVDDEAVDAALARIASSQKRTETVAEAREARSGDTVVIDFVGKTGGEPISGGAGTDHHLELGSNTFIPGFEDALVGKKVGESVSFNVTFPDQYHAELAGKEATFDVDIKELRRAAAAAVDEDLAKAFGMESLESLRAAVREQLERDYDTASRSKLKRALLDVLADGYAFDVPTGVVDMEFDSIWRQVEQAKADGSLDPEDRDKGDDVLKEEYRKVAERRVRLGLVLAEAGRRNNITVTKDDINRALMAEASRFPGQEQMVIQYYRKNPEAVDALHAPLFEEKVVDFILEMATVTDKAVKASELLDDEEDAAETPVKRRKRTPKAKKSESAQE